MARKVPHYILIAGDPDQVPFHFQTLLDSAASAGRVDFDSIGDLETYIDKVLRYERASDPTAAREALFFATDGGPGDATHFSRRFMADPLAKHVSKTRRFPTRAVIAEDATKAGFLDEARRRTPALVYAATHGMAAPKERLDIQKRVNGGICCGHETGDANEDWLMTAEDDRRSRAATPCRRDR